MAEKRLFNYLQLAYTPISNYDFATIKGDPLIRSYMNSGKIYMIVQRPVLTFQNLTFHDRGTRNPKVTFEIHQKGVDTHLRCKMPLYQEQFGAEKDSKMNIALTYTYPKPATVSLEPPFFNLTNFLLKLDNGEVIWLSPEKFLYHYWRNAISAEVIGEITNFTKYQLHYIGKATEQDIIARLTGHSHLQDILSMEYPFHYGSLPTDEICILLFNFYDNIQVSTFGSNDDIKEAAELMVGNNPISQKAIYLDAEKALIKALKPKHNRQLYNNYPKTVDGLEKHNLDLFTYSFQDPIILSYSDGEIKGQNGFVNGDTIVIKGNDVSIKFGQQNSYL